MSKSIPHHPAPPLTFKGITAVFRSKPLDELDSFLLLIRKRRFDAALSQLQPDAMASTRRLIAKHASLIPRQPEPFLHLIIQSQPPFKLFTLVWSALNKYMGGNATADETLNARKQTPLHAACESQCSADIIRELLLGRSGMIPTVCRDVDGRCPLHLLFASDTKLGPLGQVMDIVNMLLDCECFVAHMPDNYNRTPLDYARAKRVNDRIIDMLLEARMHLNDDDHDARPPTVEEDGDELPRTTTPSGPLPVEIEYDPATADDISTLDMAMETKPSSGLSLGWETADSADFVVDDYYVTKNPQESHTSDTTDDANDSETQSV